MSDSELLAMRWVERVLGRQLEPVTPANSVPDLRTTEPPLIAVEVKELTVEETRTLAARWQRTPYFDSSVLSRSWTVILPAPMLDDLLPSSSFVPPPTVSEESRAALAAAGFTVRDRVPPSTPATLRTPNPKALCRQLEPILCELEKRDVTCTRGALSGLDVRRLVLQVERLTGGGIAMSQETLGDGGQRAGIALALASGGAARGDPDRVLSRVEEFISGERGASLCLQLTACSSYAERHAFLVLDETEPEWWSSCEWTASAVPSRPPQLPEMIDALWIALRHLCWYWSSEEGWISSDARPEFPYRCHTR